MRRILSNLTFIKKNGIGKFLERQNVRIAFLRTMIDNYDDGRSKGYYCRASALLDPGTLKRSIDKATLQIRVDRIKQTDVKSRAKILRAILDEQLSKAWTH